MSTGLKKEIERIKEEAKEGDEGAIAFLKAADIPLPKGTPEPPEKTSDEAMEELERAKKKLDLELITQEEYNKIKEELKQFIK